MPVDPLIVAKAVAVAGIDGPLAYISIEVLILIELDRDTVEPFQEKLHILRVDHEPTRRTRKTRPNDNFIALIAIVDIVVS